MKIHPRHFLNGAIGAITGLTAQAVNPGQKVELELLESLITHAECWYLDQNAMDLIWHTELDPTTLQEVRLPYPVMALEYEFHNEKLGIITNFEPGLQGCPNRVTIAIDSTFFIPESNHIMIYHFYMVGNNWTYCPYTILLDYGDELAEKAVSLKLNKDNSYGEVAFKFGGLTNALSLDIIASHRGLSVDETIKIMAHDAPMTDDIRVTLGLLQLLSCNNVPTKTIPAPAKLNAKRGKRGKPAIPAYRTLHLELTKSVARPGNGTHASPRTHWRRGHLRTIHDGANRVWVRPTIVNAGVDPKPGSVKVRK